MDSSKTHDSHIIEIGDLRISRFRTSQTSPDKPEVEGAKQQWCPYS
jgi:hypothetical protein